MGIVLWKTLSTVNILSFAGFIKCQEMAGKYSVLVRFVLGLVILLSETSMQIHVSNEGLKKSLNDQGSVTKWCNPFSYYHLAFHRSTSLKEKDWKLVIFEIYIHFKNLFKIENTIPSSQKVQEKIGARLSKLVFFQIRSTWWLKMELSQVMWSLIFDFWYPPT